MNGYGTSGCTPTKDHHFREILDTHLKITRAIYRRHEWANKTYYFYDLNAGPGIDEQGRKGSPLIFTELIKHYGLEYRAFFYERCKRTAKILGSYLKDDGEVIIGDHHDTFPEAFGIREKNTFGLVYSDETGKIPPFNLLGECFSSPGFQRIDLLIYISSANVKRALKMECSNYCKRLGELINLVNKKHWIVRKPQGKHQWTFLIGTNWTDFPAFNKIGFYKTTSIEGLNIMYELNYTNKEKKGHGA